MTEKEKMRLRGRVNEAFTPAAPIQKRDLFSGRTKQFGDLADAVVSVGQHGVVFGERGVGKTSLASVAGSSSPPPHFARSG